MKKGTIFEYLRALWFAFHQMCKGTSSKIFKIMAILQTILDYVWWTTPKSGELRVLTEDFSKAIGLINRNVSRLHYLYAWWIYFANPNTNVIIHTYSRGYCFYILYFIWYTYIRVWMYVAVYIYVWIRNYICICGNRKEINC